MLNRPFFSGFVIAAMVMFLAGCATSPYQGDGKVKSDELLAAQFSFAEETLAREPPPRLIYAGFAMHSQSKAFRSDVLTAEKIALLADPSAVIFKLGNPALGQDADWPFATSENIEKVLTKVGGLARPQDKVMLLFSTHGNVDLLGINFSARDYPSVNSAFINKATAALRGKQVLMVLSACHSGSFLKPLSGPTRIVLAAAAADKSSFGCRFQSTNTYFIDALFNQSGLPERSITQLMESAKVDVDLREKKQKLSPPSLPDLLIGVSAKDWAGQSLKNWMSVK